MLASIGLILPPCGVPLFVLWNLQSSIYPAFNNLRMSLRNLLSSIRFRKVAINTLWSMLSKNPLMSPSTNHFVPCECLLDMGQGGVATSVWPESMWGVCKHLFIDGFENHAHYLLYKFVLKRRNPKRSFLPVFLGYVCPLCRIWLVRLIPQRCDDLVYLWRLIRLMVFPSVPGVMLPGLA